jgi:hypothetical protein
VTDAAGTRPRRHVLAADASSERQDIFFLARSHWTEKRSHPFPCSCRLRQRERTRFFGQKKIAFHEQINFVGNLLDDLTLMMVLQIKFMRSTKLINKD